MHCAVKESSITFKVKFSLKYRQTPHHQDDQPELDCNLEWKDCDDLMIMRNQGMFLIHKQHCINEWYYKLSAVVFCQELVDC